MTPIATSGLIKLARMRTSMRTIRGAAAALLFAMVGSAFGQEQPPVSHDHANHGNAAQSIANATPDADAQPNANAIVTWINSPPASITTVTINVLETVTWNGNFANHPLQATDSVFSTVTQTMATSGTTFALGFVLPGTYYFRCGQHPTNMRTTVIVLDPNAPPNQQGSGSRKIHSGAGTFNLPL